MSTFFTLVKSYSLLFTFVHQTALWEVFSCGSDGWVDSCLVCEAVLSSA